MGRRHTQIPFAALLWASSVAPAGLAAPVPVDLDPDIATDAPGGGQLEHWSTLDASIPLSPPCARLAAVTCDPSEDYAVVMTAHTQDGTARITASGAYSPEPRSPLASVMARPTLSVLLLVPVVFLTVWWSIGRRE